jgi:type IV pilus assembly protein PilY1
LESCNFPFSLSKSAVSGHAGEVVEMTKALLPFLCIMNLCLLLSPLVCFGGAPFSGAPYCSVPPIPGAGANNNVLLLIDNSLSMSDLAYDRGKHCTPATVTSCSADSGCAATPGQVCRDKVCTFPTPKACSADGDCSSGQLCAPDSRPFFCVDDSYRDDRDYVGYFEQKTVYRYDSAASRFQADLEAGYPLVVPSSCTGSCAAATKYLYVEMTGTAPGRKVQSFKASGNFLNWLSMSKMDLAKKVLTGGKIEAGGALVAESPGCMGKRFVKLVPDAPSITFTVRGGEAVQGTYPYEWSPGSPGQTFIEIYDRSYPKDPCFAAVRDWENATSGLYLRDHAFSCLGRQFLGTGIWINPRDGFPYHVPSAPEVYVESRALCFGNSGSLSYSLATGCMARLGGTYGGDVSKFHQNLGDEACGSDFTHPTVNHDMGGYLQANSKGYLGDNADGDMASLSQRLELKDFCAFMLSYPTFTDPSWASTRASAPSYGRSDTIPPFILDVGIYGLGAPAATLSGKIAVAAPPTGIIQQFSGPINYGAMTFNQEGLDGGKVIAAVGAAAGSHQDAGGGLVATIDRLPYSSGSPLAEAMYNAIGYFANRSDLKLQTGDFSPPAPAAYSCQKNNVVIVSDGISSADRRNEVKELVTKWVGAAGPFEIDDLAGLARTRSITDFKNEPQSAREYLTTHVVYTGPPCGVYSGGSCQTSDEAVPEKLMQLTASKGKGRIVAPATPADLEASFRELLQVLSPGSGTDVSIVSNGDGNGALFLQDLFFPARTFEAGTSAAWGGELQSLWYYIDPFLNDPSGGGSGVREDTVHDFVLTLKDDRTVSYDELRGTDVTAADANGDGTAEGTPADTTFDQMQSLWRAGKALWEADPSTRSLKTTVNGQSLIDFSAANAPLLAPYLGVTESEAAKVIAWVLGTDQQGYRNRKVTITDPLTKAVATREWKLGDIVSSTPQVQSPVPLGAYHLPPPRGYGDPSYASFICLGAKNEEECQNTEQGYGSGYRSRGLVYVGANDGILHAFNLGSLNTGPFDTGTPDAVKAKLTGTGLGKEAWGFIPRNVLPYLKYLAAPDYRHLYLVDGKLVLVDARVGEGNAWRTILVGGMGLGGATAESCPPGNDCVAIPASGGGYSSYFALDVTDPAAPALLWEFSDPGLGYATSGPAIVKSGGKWFAVFGSGPTGPIDPGQQFLGRSNQNLKFFVVELRAGAPSSGGATGIDTRIARAFAGTMTGASIDTDRWNPGSPSFYSDDAVYLGYTKDGSDGGVIRILTKDSAKVGDWSWNYVVQGAGPVTSGIARIQDRKNHQLWLYFGTGRYFFNVDDPSGARALYGVKDPCYHYSSAGVVSRPDALDPSCSLTAGVGKPGDILNTSRDGWRIDLDAGSDSVAAERVTSTPVATTAGAVFFTTFQPSRDACLPGTSYLRQAFYNSGAAPASPLLRGKGLLRTSSGHLSDRALAATAGGVPAVPGRAGSVKIVSNNGLRPVNRIIHIQER